MSYQTEHRATSKQLWKLNDLAFKRAMLVLEIEDMGGNIDISSTLHIPMPLLKKSANELIQIELEKIDLLTEMKQLLLEEAK